MKLASIVLCAGQGTRMKSDLPKVLHEACGRPLGAWPLRAAQAAGADAIVAVVGHQADRVQVALSADFGDGLAFALQEEQRGTGHAVLCGVPALPDDADDVLILYGDTPLLKPETLLALVERRRTEGVPLGLLTAELEQPAGYGRMVRDDAGVVREIVEHKDATPEQRAIREVNPGIYAVDAAFLKEKLSTLTADNAQGELYLTDLVALAYADGGTVSLPMATEEMLGVNDRRQLAEAGAVLQRRICDEWLVAGVTMRDPASVHIDATVNLAPDVTLGPGVSLRGTTRVERDVLVDVGCVLTDTIVQEGAALHPYSICEHAHVGPGCQVGPFARLRPDAHMLKGAKVGNFVEMKKTVLGEGSKANHLAYLGDATIGKGVNVGAGTITCNYDGFGKHPTILEDGVFIGSNSTLVAPLTVEENAYVAAASCVGKDVPSGALAISRARQENKDGYADRLRSRMKRRAGK
jgi:bifunctional UDP-N-acetylglucosamine pyrophosphorylase/glucosamine-1-phosphate N-acetyltransferase